MQLYRHKWCWMLRSPKFGSYPGKHQKLHKFILVDCKLKLREIAEESECSVFTILHEHLSMINLCSKWVSCLLTVDQKQLRVNNSEHFLQLFQHNKNEFLRKYVTKNETWIHHFSPKSNWLSAEWAVAGESHLKRPKMQTSAGKVLASIFWDAQGILFIDYHEKGKTTKSEYYIVLLVCLKEEITKKTAINEEEKVLFHKDNAPCHKSIATMAKLHKLHFKLLPHPPYSSYLETSKECSRERDLAPMKKWYQKLRCILRPKTNHSTKKVLND